MSPVNADRSEPRLFLASSSPYRRELLARLHQPFVFAAPEIDETPLPGEAAVDLARRLAIAKAEAARRLPGFSEQAWVIGSDQVLAHGDRCYGKPGDHATAVRQLTAFSGQTVNFYTALALCGPLATQAAAPYLGCRVVVTEVRFRELGRDQIERTLEREPAYDCAGAAKCEGLGISLMHSIRSDDPTALIGLPLIALCDLLNESAYPWL